MSQLVTGEAVALDLRPAALPSRLLARLLDGLIQFGALLVLSGLATAVSVDVSDAAGQALTLLVVVAVLLVYPVTFETLMRGRTPGKAAMGLRVVRDDGGPIGFRQALVRGLANLAEGPATFFLPAVLVSLLNAQSKRVGDLLAGTVVLRERVSVRGGPMAVMPHQLAEWASGLDLAPLSDDLAVSVRQFIARSDSLTHAAREDLGARLVAAVTAAVGPPPPGAPGWAVLHAVLAERRRRDSLRMGARPTPYGQHSPPYGQQGPPYGQQGPPYGQQVYGRPAAQPSPAPTGSGQAPPPMPPSPPAPPSPPGSFTAPS